MFRKMLIPLDGTKEPEGVIDLVRGDLAPDGMMILMTVIRPGKSLEMQGMTVYATELEEAERGKAMDYLRGVVQRMGGDPSRWHCEVILHPSVASGIVAFAKREGIDLIAMYTHDRKGLARLIKGSIASDVRRQATIEVKVFRPQEVARVA